MARYLALGRPVPVEWSSHLVRDVRDWAAIGKWLPYYIARAILLVVGVIVMWMLFAPLD